jgi:hypothetical protein
LPGLGCGRAGGDRERDDRGGAQASDMHSKPPSKHHVDCRISTTGIPLIGNLADVGFPLLAQIGAKLWWIRVGSGFKNHGLKFRSQKRY